MNRCPACQAELPTDAKFCGFCGFRQSPISREEHRNLSESYTRLKSGETSPAGPIPLTQKKGAPEEDKKAALVVVDAALDETLTARPREATPASVADTQLQRPRGIMEKARVKLPPGNAARPAVVPKPAAPGPAGPAPRRSPAPVPASKAGPAPRRSRAPQPAAAPRTGPHEQKRASRFALKVEVGMNSEHNFYTGFMENLSSGGLFVATHETMAIGDPLEINFTVPGLNRTCTALCEVRWVREYNSMYDDMVPGVGLKFSKLDAEARAAIELFLKHRDPIFFDDD